MPLHWRLSPFFGRIVLLLGTAVLSMIAVRAFADPVAAAAREQISLPTSLAITSYQVGFAGFPLGAAVFLFASLFSLRTLRMGLTFLATFIMAALAVRLYAVHAHGGLSANFRPLLAESFISALAVLGLVLETARRATQTTDSELCKNSS